MDLQETVSYSLRWRGRKEVRQGLSKTLSQNNLAWLHMKLSTLEAAGGGVQGQDAGQHSKLDKKPEDYRHCPEAA